MESETKYEVSSNELLDTKVLNEDSYNRLKSMLESEDTDNHLIAQKILNQLDVKQSIFWIWMLSRNGSRRVNMVYQRSKFSREFRDRCNLMTICGKNETEFMVWLNERGWNTPEIFMRMKKVLLNQLIRKLDNELYTVHIELKPQYKYLDDQDEFICMDEL